MTPVEFTFTVCALSYGAGVLGSLAGIGGGIIVIPMLTQLMGVDIHHAIAASIVAVIATSSGAAATYVRDHLTNIRVAMLLEVATASGALLGAALSGIMPGVALELLFAAILGYTAINMLFGHKQRELRQLPADPFTDRLRLNGVFHDGATGKDVPYRVGRAKMGLAFSTFAGLISGLLGVGGGVIKVPVMNLGMGIPLKVCTATSNLMIGVTAATGAALFFMRGEVLPFVAAPVALGVLLGARTGAILMNKVHTAVIRWIFLILMAITCVQMLFKVYQHFQQVAK